ncbi:MAG TPA: hypothetical protein VLA20_04025, partial [Vicinamibacterales bacterium]|nr:hypothetical protein [Vicinamibacterales bacterium]
YDHANITAARRLARLSETPGAEADLEFALRLVADLYPFDPGPHARLGRMLVDKKRFAEALTEFEVALALGPANVAEAHADAGEVLLELGRRDEARAQALAALKVAPAYARAQDLLLLAMGKQQ